MKAGSLSIIFGAVSSLMMAAPLAAQNGNAKPAAQFMNSAAGVRVSDLMGGRVLGADGTILGVVNDIMFDQGGHVAAVVVAVGPDRGLGEKDIAVPYTAISMDLTLPASAITSGPRTRAQPGTVMVRLNVTQQQLAAAPAFQVNHQRGSAGTPESAHRPKSSTESGGPG